MTEQLLEKVALAVNGTTKAKFENVELDFAGPYPRLSITDAILQYTGLDVETLGEEEIRAKCREWGMDVNESMGKGKLIDEIFGEKVEEHIIQPTFITDHPVEMSPLTKKHRTKKGMVERFELFVNGREIANAYSELNDPLEQKARFDDQLKLKERGDDEAMEMDDDFIRSLEYGMPPSSGIGIGIDRLTMLLTDNSSIQEVIFFPQMRPEKKPEFAKDSDYANAGVPAVWIPALQKMNILTIEQLKSSNPNKIFNDLGGMRKKLKIEEKMPSLDDVKSWVEA